MRTWMIRLRYAGLALTATTLIGLNGCGLSDQQLATVWQSVLTSGLNTLIGNILASSFGTGA